MNRVRTIVISLLIAALAIIGSMSFVIYKLFLQQQELKRIVMTERKEEPAKQVEVIEKIISRSVSSWSELQDKLRNTVVQVFSQIAEIDLLQPYRAPNQFQGTGSGFFINADGELVTNAHVIDQAKAIWIQIPSLGKRQIDVDVVGLSFERDIALLKVRPEGLILIRQELKQVPFLKLGDSDLVHRADEIMTLGYPLGQQGLKSTVGVVSGQEEHHIQIDAPINPGNSGGPSVNAQGEVIGINRMFITNAQNVNYIIPINQLKIILEDLRAVRLLRKPFLGILFNNANESMTRLLGNPPPGGVYVVDVYKGSPLHKAGVQKRDMIYEINGHTLDIYGEMLWNGERISIIDYVSQLKLGQNVHLVVYRNGKRKDVNFTFGQTEPMPIRKIYAGYEKLDYEIVGGMVIEQLSINLIPLLVNTVPSLIKYTEMKNQMEPALVITHIFPDSQAQRSRSLIGGSVIQEVNGQRAKTLDDLRHALSKSKETGVLTLETVDSVFVVFPFQKVLEDEKRLSQDYFYQISPVMQQLMKEALQHDTAPTFTKSLAAPAA